MADFVRLVWGIHHRAPIQWGWHVDCICEHLEAVHRKEIQHLIINIQPGFIKSLLVSVYFPSWVWTRDPGWQFLCTSATDDVVFRDARRHQEIMASDTYQEIFRPRWQMLPGQNAKGYFVNSMGGHRISRTTGQSITGLRADCRIMDDPVDASKAYADKSRITDINVWIDRAFLNRTNDPDSPLVLIMQRIAENDPSAHLLELGLPKTAHVCLPAEQDPKRVFVSPVIRRETAQPWTDPRAEGELLHPERFGADDAAAKKKDEFTWVSQYQQDPTPAGGNIFQLDDFRYWSHDGDPERNVIKLEDTFDYKVITGDFNNLKFGRGKKNTDFACIDLWAARGLDRFLLLQIRQKLNVAASIHALIDLIDRTDGLHGVFLEKAANGPSVIAGLKAHYGLEPNDESFIRGISVQGESKIQRAEAANRVVTEGRVYIPDPQENGEVGYWLQEVCGFPARTRDDRVDTMTMALIQMEKINISPVWSLSLGGGKAH